MDDVEVWCLFECCEKFLHSACVGHYAYYQLCIDNTRPYYHAVEIFLEPVLLPTDESQSSLKAIRGHRHRTPVDVDMYLSAHIHKPTIQKSTWITAKPGSDHIKLFTDLNDWVRSLCDAFVWWTLTQSVHHDEGTKLPRIAHRRSCAKGRCCVYNTVGFLLCVAYHGSKIV